ncbi:serine/threonine-protein kinase DCLK2-like isoform X2 [Rhopilema esculentum]|uniref:serine/threonine-protein kinase DCLK2-like isoform X2 n=1 Tax=Rhopilema esculentum TaxID=499914 RepID=UPI0031D2DA7B
MDVSRDSGRYTPTSTSNLSRSSSMRSNSRTSLIRRNQSISAKQIRFYRNGDKYFGGLKLAVSPERYKEFDSLLAELSVKLDLATGAVRFIFNAEDGSLITDISQLQYGIPYVCCSGNTFRPLDEGYGKQSSNNWSMNRQRHVSRSTNALTSLEANTQRDALVNIGNHRDFIKPKLVTVIKNGKPPQQKVTMLLNQKTAVSYDQVLDHLSARGCLGKVDKLYAVDGKLVRDLRDLFDDDTVFIAFASNEKFPEEGIELDTKSYRITPYRELKRPSNLKRSNSLRSSLGKFRDENENMKGKGKSPRPKSIGPGSKLMNSVPKSPRGKVNGSKKMNGDAGKEELYPTAVFERESSDSGLQEDFKNRMLTKRERPSIHGFYKIGKIIGDGNFAVVRECRHRKSGLSFALKVINKAKVRGKEHMIENEILILRKVKHRHIVQLVEEFETPKEILLVMELVPGGDLFDAIVEATRFTEKDASHMIRDLTSAVQYLHSLRIVHRDIKPENLLVVNRSDGTTSLKLADFGLSIEVKSPMFLVCGTPTYVAPEILDESGYGLKVDIWAVGVITYILLCGFPPFRSHKQDQEELFDKILRGDYEFLQPFWDDVSESAKDLIQRLLVVDVKKRYDAADILEHPWIKGHTAKSKNLQEKLSTEIEKNFTHRRRLRGVALAIQTVIYLSNVIKRKQNQGNGTRSCAEIQRKFSWEEDPVLEEKPNTASRKRSASFEESLSFDRSDSYDDEVPASFPSSPVRRASLSSRIPRAKSTTPSQHIAEIRKSISSSNKTSDIKGQNLKSKDTRRNSTYRPRADQFSTVSLAHQKVNCETSNNDLKPQSVTLRNRPSSAKETYCTKRLSAPVLDSIPHTQSLPSSPKHGIITTFAPGVKKRTPLAKCISVDDSVKNKPSAIPSYMHDTEASTVHRRTSVSDAKKSRYRASYPNRSLASAAVETLTVKPRGQRRGSVPIEEHVKPEQRERPLSEKSAGHARKGSVVRKRLPKAITSSQDLQQQNCTKRSKDTVDNAARTSTLETAPDNSDVDSSRDADISIVKKYNKTENIKIHLGKTVDKSVETSTTVSVTIDGEKKKASSSNEVSKQPYGLGRSLLTKVKQLAEEIETLAMFNAHGEAADNASRESFPHSCSMPVLHGGDLEEQIESDTTLSSGSNSRDLSYGNRLLLEQDSFSETEYLSINMKSPRNGNSPTSIDQ